VDVKVCLKEVHELVLNKVNTAVYFHILFSSPILIVISVLVTFTNIFSGIIDIASRKQQITEKDKNSLG
jgi:hypothetical protein